MYCTVHAELFYLKTTHGRNNLRQIYIQNSSFKNYFALASVNPVVSEGLR